MYDILVGLQELIKGVVASHESGVIPSSELKTAIHNQKLMFPKGIPQCGTDALRMSLCSHPIESKKLIIFGL